VGFNIIDQLLIRFFAFVRYCIKKWEYFKKVYGSVRRELLYSILIEFGVPMKLVMLIKMCLNETYSKVRTGKYLSDTFPIQTVLKEGAALSPLLFNFALEQWYSTWGTRRHLTVYVKFKKKIYYNNIFF
jgi:hypothetical protein